MRGMTYHGMHNAPNNLAYAMQRLNMQQHELHGMLDARWTYTNVSGPQPHSHQWPCDENERIEMHAHMHECQGPNLRHEIPLYQSMARDERWHTNMQFTALKYDAQWSRIMQTWHTMQARGPGYRN